MEKLSALRETNERLDHFKPTCKRRSNLVVCVVYNLERHIEDTVIQCFAVIHTLAEQTDFLSCLNTKK